jgi:phage repressor protein C with HTH and peptisase S24 domain
MVLTRGTAHGKAKPDAELFDVPTLAGQPRDVPVFGSALAADLVFDADGKGPEPVEITNFVMGEAITYVRRPPGLNDEQRAYGIFVSGSSMEPRYRPGDPVFVDPRRPPSIGDDVVVQLQAADDSGDIVSGLIKTLVRRTSTMLELEQYQPHMRFQVPIERVAHIHRVIPWREAFGI